MNAKADDGQALRVELPVAADADAAAVRRWLEGRVVEPAALAELLESSAPQLYGNVEGEALWIGVHLPGRQRSRQSLFHGALHQRNGRWRLEGRWRPSLSDRVNEVLLGTVAVASLGLGLVGAMALAPALVVAAVLLALVVALRRGGRRSRARDEALLRDLLRHDPDEEPDA